MLRKLFALVLALVIAVVGTVKPAYAVSDSSSLLNSYNTDFLAAITNEVVKDEIVKVAVDAAVNGTVTIAVTLAVCYGADALATSVFPPAAALAPFCPVLAGGTGAVVGTGTAVGEGMAVGTAGAATAIGAVKTLAK